MSDDARSPADVPAIITSGIAASIPAAMIAAAIRSRGQQFADAASDRPVTIDAGALAIEVSPAALAELLTAALPGHAISVAFADGAILVRMDALPPIRVALPEDGLRLRATEDGLRLGDDRAHG